MEVVTYKTKVGSGRMHPDLAFFAMLFILLNAYCCNAFVIVKSNNSFRCSGRLDECLFEEELELELLMNPYVSRMLVSYKIKPTPGIAGQPAIACGKPQDAANPQYNTCIAEVKRDLHLCVQGSIFTRCGGNNPP
ncbi:hypothetical protein I3843_03G082800 [Carya illinoinensis]|nr:hypothetical protein I3843_03G082800 [Carya illinoinensis]